MSTDLNPEFCQTMRPAAEEHSCVPGCERHLKELFVCRWHLASNLVAEASCCPLTGPNGGRAHRRTPFSCTRTLTLQANRLEFGEHRSP